MVKVIVPLR